MTSGQELLSALEQASRGIHDPVAKLRYIRGSLVRYRRWDRVLQAVPGGPLRRWLYRRLSLESLRALLRSNPMGARPVAPRRLLDARTRRALAWNRPIAALSALCVLAAVAAALSAAKRLQPDRGADGVVAAAALPAVAERLPSLPKGMTPSRVWLVENGANWEQYSHGLRIDTSFAVDGEPRRFRVFRPGGGLAPETQQTPVGILFHTSESDIWPLEEAFNESLRDSSHRLLRYVQRKRLYHYLIDRFGRVFRVVAEDARANHAGHSIWQARGGVHLNLNNAFLGVSFESRWEGGHALPITQAQLAAGRSLTDYLRQRYKIAPEMCVTHGLTSVNPRKHLIGHHLDWARGFPFEAFGLPDQYRRPAPSVALFGFAYDEDFLKVLGEPWPGVRSAEAELAREAATLGRTPDDVRRQRQTVYDEWLAQQVREEAAAAARPVPGRQASLPPASARTSGPTRALAPSVGPPTGKAR
jgi:hypothetical protein